MVARNLQIGLDRAGIPYRVDPGHDHTPWAGVLGDPDALQWAITRKRAGLIDWLVAGPNFAQPALGPIIASPEIDRVVVASAWLRELYVAQAPELDERINVWPVGTDEELWVPATVPAERDVLVYSKAHPPELLEHVLEALRAAGLSWTVLAYGAHDATSYRRLLGRHHWALFLSQNEGQGIALLEAWSCNVPTLVWSPGHWELEGHTWDRASSAPYLSERTGVSFRDRSELPEAIARMMRGGFAPRSDVLERFTAAGCARAYRDLFPPETVSP